MSALEFGYSCDQAGWIFIHADERDEHERDGEWTAAIDEDNYIDFEHWVEAVEARFEGESFTVMCVDGSSFVVSAEGEEEADEDPFVVAIGKMILSVLMQAKQDRVFTSLEKFGAVQLDIEDFNGGWGWPEYDELGKVNLV